MTEPVQYESSDVWILAALVPIAKDQPATLQDIIRVGDFINHAIFTIPELNGGFSRLSRGGLVKVQSGKLQLTEEGIRVTEIDPKAKKGPLFHMDTIQARIGAKAWSADPNAMDDPERSIEYVTKADFDQACDDYLASFNQTKGKK